MESHDAEFAEAGGYRLRTLTVIWECETCGWTCAPNPYLALSEAECDNCGDVLAERKITGG